MATAESKADRASSQPQEIKLSDYRAPSFTTEKVALTFDIEDGQTTVTSELHVTSNGAGDSIYLNGMDLTLVSVELDGNALSGNEYDLDDESLTIHNLDSNHVIKIVTQIEPEKNTALEGLYKSSKMYCTQCEAEGFRKITYYQDRPDVLAKFTTTVIADGNQYPTLLSNGNKVASQILEGGRTSVTWEDPFPKPSYLFALVAGDLQLIEDTFKTMSGREVTLQIFSEPHNIDKCDYAMDVLKRSMTWDEETYGREYDLDIFMIVAVEDFNMGAMENKGLNIFNTSCVLANPNTATDAAYLRVEAVVAHEYFHNWSGNRVTCRDWFQLSLKEGFTVFRDAEFSSDMNSRPVKRIEDVSFLRSVQFAEDGGPLSHPVRPQAYLEISNFYTTTIYEKGAEVVRMYHTLLGADKFRQGCDDYFDRFDGSAATTDDFKAAMAKAGGMDLAQFQNWYDQAGTPVLSVTESFDSGCLELRVRQSCPGTPGQQTKLPYHMPVALGLLDAAGSPICFSDIEVKTDAVTQLRDGARTLLLELREDATTISFQGLTDQPKVSFLRGFSAPVRVEYPREDSELGFIAKHDTDGYVRWDAMQSLWMRPFEAECDVESLAVASLIPALGEQTLAMGTDDVEQKLLAATMLAMPDENYLFEQLSDFEVNKVLDTRETLHAYLAEQNVDLWRQMYDQFRSAADYEPTPGAMANRALFNLSLGYLAKAARADDAWELLSQHYYNADNLTDRRAALFIASRHPILTDKQREALFADFYDHWHDEALVLDLWFNLQAQSPLSNIDKLRQLEAHDKFDAKNPNRARAVYSAFGMLNHRVFHNVDGSGYQYLADVVAQLDKANPQLASRVATPLTRWQRYDIKRGQLMKNSLQSIHDQTGLSKDLFEIVSKSLN